MTRAKAHPKRPWAKVKAAARVLTPDERWAAELADRVLADAHPWQRNAVEDPASRVSMLVGRGGTKTTTMRIRGLIKIMKIRRGIVVYCATSRAQAEELMWFKLKDMVEAYGVTPEFSFLDSKLRMTCLRTGATYRLFGVEDKRDAEKLRGQPFDEVQADECGSWEPRLLEHFVDRVVAPRIGERHGAIVLGGTPPPYHSGENLFYDATRLGSDQHRAYADRDKPEYLGWLRWSSHAWSLKDVVDLPDSDLRYPALVANWTEALQQKDRKQWGDDNPVWMREHLGLWAADQTDRVFDYRAHVDGAEWNQWDPFHGQRVDGVAALETAIAALPTDVGTWHYVLAMDMGSKDPFACNVFAFAPLDAKRRMFHVFAFERVEMYAKPIAELLIGPDLNTDQPGGIFRYTGWPDAMEMDADLATLNELSNVYGLRIKKAEKKADYKFGAIELVNGDLVEGRIKVLKGSPLELQLGQLQWKPDEYGTMREDKAQANHSTDTLVYARRALANLFETGAVEADQPAASERAVDAAEWGNRRRVDLESLLADPDFDDSEGDLL